MEFIYKLVVFDHKNFNKQVYYDMWTGFNISEQITVPPDQGCFGL